MTTSNVLFPNPSYTGAAAATSSSVTSGSGAAAGATLGGTNFLTLMLAQLKNQDPTSPVDSNQFLNQLASLSTVQGITQLNTSFGSLKQIDAGLLNIGYAESGPADGSRSFRWNDRGLGDL